MKLLLITALSSAVLMASSLTQLATNNGLAPIPDSKSELLKLIDNPKNPITQKSLSNGALNRVSLLILQAFSA